MNKINDNIVIILFCILCFETHLMDFSKLTNLFLPKKELDHEPIYVTREEIEELKREHEELKNKMKEIMI